MKKNNFIIGKLLLFIMITFMMHDFVSVQTDIVNFNKNYDACKDTKQVVQVSSEHHLFHIPMILINHSLRIDMHCVKNKINTSHPFILENLYPNLFTPPKIA